VEARIEQNDRDETYRIYSSEMLRYIAKAWGYDAKSYIDILHPPPEETRTSEEVISGMKNLLHSLGGEEDESI
jgi:hypothetical protein